MNPHVFTIPASAPFLPTLIEALSAGRLGFAVADDPLALAAATLYLPTRRACRLARDAFLDALKATPPSCRASSRSAISTRTKSLSPRAATGRHRRRRARPAAGARRARTAAAAHAAHRQVGAIAGASRRERRAASRPDAGGGVRARRRSGAADRRHDDARRALGPSRQSGARRLRRILAADAANSCRSRASNGRRF